MVDVAARSSAPKTLPTASRCPARQLQRARFAAGTATINRERRKSIREEVGTSRSLPLTSARRRGKAAVDVAARSGAQPYPLLAAARQRSRFAAETATVNRERWKSIREEVGTSRSSPLARARRSEKAAVDVVARLFSAHCPPTASRWSRAAATNQTRGRNCNL